MALPSIASTMTLAGVVAISKRDTFMSLTPPWPPTTESTEWATRTKPTDNTASMFLWKSPSATTTRNHAK